MGMMDIIDAIIRQESGGNPRSLNPRTGAMGLMQVMPETARNPGFGVKPLTDPWNPAENRRFGTDYFNAMAKRYPGDRDAALAAYNWGPGNADKWVASGKTRALPPETQNYIRNINAMAGGGAPAPAAQPRGPAPGGQPMDDPFADYWGTPEQPDFPKRTPMSIGAGRGPQTVPPRPTPPQPSDNLPQFLGGSDQPGFVGRMMADPTFLTGMSVLSGGLQGQDFGSALQRGTQAAQSASQMQEAQRRRAAWSRIFRSDGTVNHDAPILRRVPKDALPFIAQMGPDEGMKTLMSLAFKPRQLTPVPAGSSLYDEQTGQVAYTAPPKSDAPAGYRASADGNLEAIPGGPATHLAGDQAGRLALMRQARADLEQAKQIFGGDMGVTGRVAKVFGMGETGQAERTVQTAVEATLRALSGAAAPQTEVDRYNAIFAPSIYDGPQTRTDKLRRLEEFISDADQLITQGRGPAMPQQAGPAPRSTPRSNRADDPLGILD